MSYNRDELRVEVLLVIGLGYSGHPKTSTRNIIEKEVYFSSLLWKLPFVVIN